MYKQKTNKYTFIFFIALLYSCNNNPASSIKKHSEIFGMRHHEISYFDYKEAFLKAKEERKPLLIIFCGWGVINTPIFEKEVISKPLVLEYLKANYIVLNLYVDDRTLLPKEEWIKSLHTQKYLKTIGAINGELQVTKFHISSQPYWAVIGLDENIIAEKNTDNRDEDGFLAFLKDARQKYLSRQNKE